jgi:hypothetical protein
VAEVSGKVICSLPAVGVVRTATIRKLRSE